MPISAAPSPSFDDWRASANAVCRRYRTRIDQARNRLKTGMDSRQHVFDSEPAAGDLAGAYQAMTAELESAPEPKDSAVIDDWLASVKARNTAMSKLESEMLLYGSGATDGKAFLTQLSDYGAKNALVQSNARSPLYILDCVDPT